MGVPIDFQHEWNAFIGIMASIIVIIVGTYYLLLKGKSSSKPNDYADAPSTQSTSGQQHPLETNRHQRIFTSKLDTNGRYITDGQPTQPSATADNFDNSILHTCESSAGIRETMTSGSQGIKEFLAHDIGLLLPSTFTVDEAMVPNSTGDSAMAARGINTLSETKKISKVAADLDVSTRYNNSTTATTSATGSVATIETIGEALKSNGNMGISKPMINTAHSTTTLKPSSAHMEYQQKDGMNGNDKCGEGGISSTVDEVETINDNEDWVSYQTTVNPAMKLSAPPTSIDDTKIIESPGHAYYVTSPNLTHMNDNAKMNEVSGNLGMESCSKNKNDLSATPQKHKEAYKHDTPPPATNINSANEPTIPNKTKRSVKMDKAATNHSKTKLVSVHKPKQDKARLESIDQQRQSYIAVYKSRCEFWPKCTNKHCKYYHPFMKCKNGNRCKFGQKCVFLHPQDYLDNQYPKRNGQGKKKHKSKTKTAGDE